MSMNLSTGQSRRSVSGIKNKIKSLITNSGLNHLSTVSAEPHNLKLLKMVDNGS